VLKLTKSATVLFSDAVEGLSGRIIKVNVHLRYRIKVPIEEEYFEEKIRAYLMRYGDQSSPERPLLLGPASKMRSNSHRT
jgi:hypothetical protein